MSIFGGTTDREKDGHYVGGRKLTQEESDARYAEKGGNMGSLLKERAKADRLGYDSVEEMHYQERKDPEDRKSSTKPKTSGTVGNKPTTTTTSPKLSTQVMPKTTTGGLTPNPTYTPGKTVDLSGLKNAIGSRPTQYMNLGEYKNYIDRIANAGGADVAVDPARFQTTTHLADLLKQMNEVLAPQTQAQKNAATSSFNQAMQANDSKWAARGLGASGAAAAEARAGANALAGQMAGIEADQQAVAAQLGLNYADLGLRESDQRFNQQQSNRQFDLNRATGAASGYMDGLTFQEQQLQNYLNNLKDVTGMEMGQNQWSQEFGLERQQADFGRWLDSSRFYEDQRQFDENMDQRKYEYDKDLDFRYDDLDFRRDSFDREYDYRDSELDQRRYEYDNDMDQRQYEYDNDYRLREGELTGIYNPYSAGSGGARYAMSASGSPAGMSTMSASGAANTKGLINNLLNLKKQANQASASGATPQQMAAFKAQGDAIRQELALNGVDPSLYGSNVTYDQALQNLASTGGGGIQTLAMRDFLAGRQDRAFDELMRQNEYEQDVLNSNRNYQLDQARYNQDVINSGYDNRYKESGIRDREFERNSQIATNGYMSSVLSLGSRDEALDYIAKYGGSMANDGADVMAIMDAVERRWGGMSEKEKVALQNAILEGQLKQQRLQEEQGTSSGSFWNSSGE
ncbi:hypothetical protein [Brevibacillus migulae]|uniref:hypothetical protein n=1 Tax=Brevibacillus migulae TaxID=1644114 RepID=UPI002E26C1FB